jgi:hypothetical protein
MLLKLALWYVRKVAMAAPSGTGHLDATTGKVVWPESA